MPLTPMRRAIISKLGVTVSGYLKFAIEVVDPAAYKGRCISWEIPFKNFYFIQFSPLRKDSKKHQGYRHGFKPDDGQLF